MQPDTAEISSGSQPKPSGKVRLLTLEDLDGRTRAAQQVRETRAAVMEDLGGEDRLSTLERLAADNVALVAAMIADTGARWLQGEQLDPSAIATLQNTFNRTAQILGWQRRARDVTPDLKAYARTLSESPAASSSSASVVAATAQNSPAGNVGTPAGAPQ
ncbi:hypothetical protein [Nitrobacter winogradskyi]|uniref:Uncharacterized protein n=3 Tax=Nitrobacter winogradskyi TaxID=913 RepID=A0ACC6AEW3_NITWI|nr:hypothetical protein [Nitrobacter winogradskyi]MCP1998141.1 hypothetical protein [Nitrobacter winogradskyi]GEC15266.1 hypothetical protein NWI01_11580 [Nitrobacter winogradskyi]